MRLPPLSWPARFSSCLRRLCRKTSTCRARPASVWASISKAAFSSRWAWIRKKPFSPHSSTAGKCFARRPVRQGSPSLAPARCPAACRNSSSPAPTRSMRSLPSPRRTPLKSCPERPVPGPTARSTCPTRSRRPSLSRRRIWPWIRCCVPSPAASTSSAWRNRISASSRATASSSSFPA